MSVEQILAHAPYVETGILEFSFLIKYVSVAREMNMLHVGHVSLAMKDISEHSAEKFVRTIVSSAFHTNCVLLAEMAGPERSVNAAQTVNKMEMKKNGAVRTEFV